MIYVKVILSQDVKSLGKKGDIKEVAEGYARNYLFPRNLAVEASGGQMKQHRHQEMITAGKKAKALSDAENLAQRLRGKTVEISAKAGQSGRLFGSVTSGDIAQALKDMGISVDKRKVEMSDPLKAVGTYSVRIKLHPEVEATIAVNVRS